MNRDQAHCTRPSIDIESVFEKSLSGSPITIDACRAGSCFISNAGFSRMAIAMAEQERKEPLKTDASSAGGRSAPQDTKILRQALVELNISRKNFAIYPLGHVQIARSIDRAHGFLTRLITSWPDLVLGVTRDRMFVGEDQLDTKNPIYKEFSNALHSHGIAGVSFVSGLTKAEVLDFLKIITTGPEEISELGGIAQAMNKTGIRHIKIEVIDYARFHLTEEAEIFQTESKSKLQPKTDIWQEFISNLISGQLTRNVSDARPERLFKIDPSELARFLNDRKLDLALAIQSYQKILATERREKIGRQPDEKLSALLKNLQPELRQQFLSITFDHVVKGAEDLLGSFTDDIVFQILQRANEERKEISPTLVALLERLSATASAVPMPPATDEVPTTEPGSDAIEKRMEKLLERESYETYVDEGYSSLLQRLGGVHKGEDQRPSTSTSKADQDQTYGLLRPGVKDLAAMEKVQGALDESHLDLQIGNMIIALIEQDLALEDYTGFARKLVTTAADLLDHGEFDFVLKILQTLSRHTQDKPPAVRGVASECLQSFNTPDFVTKVLKVLRACSREQVAAVSKILSALGSSCVPGLMDLYAEDESPGSKKVLLNLLKAFGKDALDEAHKRLTDSRVHVLRNLLILIGDMGTKESIPHIRPLLSHPSHVVRLEALTELLKYEDPERLTLLRNALRSKEHQEFSHAVLLSGHYRVAEVADDLAGMIRKFPWRKLDFRRNEEIIRSLGKIGDSRVLPLLERLARKSLTIYPGALRDMKVALFESLNGYPKESISALLKIGQESGDYRIKRVCGELTMKQ
jgi:hypothetical protein